VLILFKQSGLFVSDHAVAPILGHFVGCLRGTDGLDTHSRFNNFQQKKLKNQRTCLSLGNDRKMTYALRYLLFLFLVYIAVLAQSEKLDDTCLADGTCSQTNEGRNSVNRDVDGELDIIEQGEQDDEVEYNDEEESGWVEEESGWEDPECFDDEEECAEWAEDGECENSPDYMLQFCRKSCELCNVDFDVIQDVYAGGEERVAEVQAIVDATIEYMANVVMVEDKYEQVRKVCKNRDALCAYWKLIGECDNASEYMNIHCAPTCQTCELGASCPTEPFSADILGPGDLNKMFEKITMDEEFQKYRPRILSRPAPVGNSEDQNQDFEIGPWVVTLDDYITTEECEALIEFGAQDGYERSTTGDLIKTVTNDKERTSSNAWCFDTCASHPLGKSVIEKIENLTGIPPIYSESLQLLKYTEGQFYTTHHDYLDNSEKTLGGPRVVTVFVYLSDVEEGGGTEFPYIGNGITVQPKRGRVLIWPSVLDEAPDEPDDRTEHQALPIIKGTKYGANAWIHLRDYKTPEKLGCGFKELL
jgi:prolyl 4-hydroxylase